MKNHKAPDDFTAKYEQIRLRSKQRLIGSIVILIFALFLLLYVIAKIKPLSSNTTIIMKTKASDTEQLGIKQLVKTGKADTSSNMIQVVEHKDIVTNETVAPSENTASEAIVATKETMREVTREATREASAVKPRQMIKPHRNSAKTRAVRPVNKHLDPEAILNGHA